MVATPTDFHAAAVMFGKPGILRVAAVGTAEPTDSTSAWPTGWYALGYTAEGSAFNYNISVDNVDVAEELDVFARVTTGRDASVEFALAEMTYRNLMLAFNGGVVTVAEVGTTGYGAVIDFEPPDLGNETRVAIGWDSTSNIGASGTNPLRFIFRQCLQGGSLGIENRKGTAKQTLSMNFQLEKPSIGASAGKKVLRILGRNILNPVTA